MGLAVGTINQKQGCPPRDGICGLIILIGTGGSHNIVKALKAGVGAADTFRGIFFALTFFTISLMSNFKKLKEQGMAKLALVYVICLFGFIIWIGFAISLVFFHGITPPVVS